jgi:hypothetical protein
MHVIAPAVVTRDGPDLTVEVNGQVIKMICDTTKWECRFGIGDSGSTIRVTFKPKEKVKRRKNQSNNDINKNK